MDIFSLGASLDANGVAGALTGGGKLDGPQYELRVGAFTNRELEFISYESEEKLSAPYVYDVVFASSVPVDLLQAGVFGFPACLKIETVHAPRVIQGLAVSFEAIGAAHFELTTKVRRYATRIVPRLWLLGLNRTYRVFQDKSAIEIACAILGQAGITPTLRLQRTDYPPIPFMYQRGETDLEFLHHVLAVAGVFYYFEHASGWLDSLLPGASAVGAFAGSLGGLASAAASVSGGFSLGGGGVQVGGGLGAGLAGGVGGALGAAGGAVASVGSAVGATTTLVLCDAARHTYGLHEDSAASAIGAAAAGVLGSALGSLGGPIGAAADTVASIADGSTVDSLTYDTDGQTAVSRERVFLFRTRAEVRPKTVTLRDWNVVENAGLTQAKRAAPVGIDPTAAVTAAVGLLSHGSLSATAPATLDIDALPIAANDVSVTEYARDGSLLAASDPFAARALDQLRSDRVTARGESDSRRIAPGYRFKLDRHPIAPVNREYLVTAVRSSGYAPDHLPADCPHLYRNTFTCVPAFIDPRPPKPPPRPPLGPETATVIGPVYDDVHCDAAGRIHVRFHWADDSASGNGTCWVHWQEPWAGDGYGMHHLPRVGSEVVVQFLQQEGGRPVATGQLYSRAHARPFPSPDAQLHVGITARVGGVTLDDTPGRERVTIRSNRELRVEASQSATTVFGALDATVENARRETTGGDATHVFDKNVSTTIAGTYDQSIRADCSVSVGGSVREDIGGAVVRRIAGPVATAVELQHRALFEDDTVEHHLGHRTIIVGSPDEPRSLGLLVEGFAWSSIRSGELVTRDGFRLTCGDTHIHVTPKGVTISTPNLRFDTNDTQLATKTISISATDTMSLAAQTFTAAGSGSSISLDDNATIKGTKVHLNPPGGATSASSASATAAPPTRLVLTDNEGKPLANRQILVRIGGASGLVRTVVLDDDGSLEVDGTDPIDVAFPENPDAEANV